MLRLQLWPPNSRSFLARCNYNLTTQEGLNVVRCAVTSAMPCSRGIFAVQRPTFPSATAAKEAKSATETWRHIALDQDTPQGFQHRLDKMWV